MLLQTDLKLNRDWRDDQSLERPETRDQRPETDKPLPRPRSRLVLGSLLILPSTRIHLHLITRPHELWHVDRDAVLERRRLGRRRLRRGLHDRRRVDDLEHERVRQLDA